jgi:copper chaperone CopZ
MMTTLTSTFSVEGMTCGGCEKSVVNAISGLPGVAQASADRQQNRVIVTWQEGATVPEQQRYSQAIFEAIEAAGFDCRIA